MRWDEEAKAMYKNKSEEIGQKELKEDESIDAIWEKLKDLVKSSMNYTTKIKIRKRKLGYRDWWDKECTKKKRAVRSLYNLWKKGKGRGEKSMWLEEEDSENSQKVKGWREKRQREEKLKMLRNEANIWKVINKKRNKKEWNENNIRKEVWRDYFMKLLGGLEKDSEEERKEPRTEWIETGKEKELEEEEIYAAVRKMKLKKAAGIDGIPMEAWRFGGEAIKKGFLDLIKRIWKDESIPAEQRKSIIVPLYKRGDAEEVSNYRGISLLCSAYKIFMLKF